MLFLLQNKPLQSFKPFDPRISQTHFKAFFALLIVSVVVKDLDDIMKSVLLGSKFLMIFNMSEGSILETK